MNNFFTALFVSLCLLPFSGWSQCSTADCPSNDNACNSDPTCCIATGAVGATIDDCLNAAGVTSIRVKYNATISSGTDATNALICLNSNSNLSIANNVTVDNTTCFAATGNNDVEIMINSGGQAVTFNAGPDLDELNMAIASLSGPSTIQNVVIALPVELITYSVKETTDGMLLEWSTATEHNNKYFLIERSSDGRFYQEITTIAARGDGSQTQYYQYLDNKANAGINYYRLTQFDFDGTNANLGIVQINKDSKQYSFTPNPVASGDFIRFDASIEEKDLTQTNFQLINSLGQVWSLTFEQGGLAIPNGLSEGLYYLAIQQPSGQIISPIVIH